jgi:hypothetical protein
VGIRRRKEALAKREKPPREEHGQPLRAVARPVKHASPLPPADAGIIQQRLAPRPNWDEAARRVPFLISRIHTVETVFHDQSSRLHGKLGVHPVLSGCYFLDSNFSRSPFSLRELKLLLHGSFTAGPRIPVERVSHTACLMFLWDLTSHGTWGEKKGCQWHLLFLLLADRRQNARQRTVWYCLGDLHEAIAKACFSFNSDIPRITRR